MGSRMRLSRFFITSGEGAVYKSPTPWDVVVVDKVADSICGPVSSDRVVDN